MIIEVFQDLFELEAIEAVLIAGSDNSVIESRAASHFNKQIFYDLGLNYHQIFSACRKTQADSNEVVIAFEKTQIYSRIYSGLLIVVVSKPKVRIPLIRLIINLGIAQWEESKKYKKILKKITSVKRDFLNEDSLDDVEEEYLRRLDES